MTKDNRQLLLFESGDQEHLRLTGINWPPESRFPLNIPSQRTVQSTVIPDLLNSDNPLLVTGYASLDHIIALISQLPANATQVRLLFGSEPFPSRRETFSMSQHSFPTEVEHYWLSRGVSLLLSGKIVFARELLASGRIAARHLGTNHSRLHAKIYCGDEAVTLGSSNFTAPGMQRQIEANVRFSRTSEKRRFDETTRIAENLWAKGHDYNEGLDELLQMLLKLVDWSEALARACAELLEGEWAKRHLQQLLLADDAPLWPSQVQGIAQALWLIETVGSVLVADATGSGKTRMGAHLMRAVVDRIWSSGRIRKGRPVMVCPPAVSQNWEHEATLCGLTLDTRSHGILSRSESAQFDNVREALRRAQVLAVDEAHNFLNQKSNRTRMLLGNMADHTLLFTATPINKSAIDLLRLADMLGADNLDDSTLEMFDQLLRFRSERSLTEKELDQLRREIQRFTVRRTKSRLNAMVDENPSAFRDHTGKPCRYPKHESRTYGLSESLADRKVAASIFEKAQQLIGIGLISKAIEMPEVLIRESWTEEKYLAARLLAARKLSAYLVMVALRSSRAALLEHLIGTEAALQETGLPPAAKRSVTGNQIQKLSKAAGTAPGSKLSIDVPDWLTDNKAHSLVAADEGGLYTEILSLARELSAEREATKGQVLLNLLEDHAQIVAFDRSPITLAFLRQMLIRNLGPKRIILATGESTTGKREATKALAPGSTEQGIVALCSDAMSEGLNLQQASAIVHLDMPTVLRVAEQRVGRVDRMDSPHTTIEAWWPDDAEEFALRADERFLERYETVNTLLGSNLPLPPEMSFTESRTVRTPELIAEYEQSGEDKTWDGLQDAFAPVRSLIESSTALVPENVYSHYRDSKARVVARVSVVSAKDLWAFFCVSGSKIGAPHWILLEGGQQQPLTRLGHIEQSLRGKLNSSTENLDFDDRAADALETMLARLANAERRLLPSKKQRAIEEMEYVLRRYEKMAGEMKTGNLVDRIRNVLAIFDPKYRGKGIDWNTISEKWLDLVRPVWYARLTATRRKRPLRLKDIRRDLLDERRLDFASVCDEFESIEALPPLDERVVSCILGLGSRSST